MKKGIFLAAVFAAGALFFNSCDKENEKKGAPTITFDQGSTVAVTSDGKVTITGVVSAPSDAEIEDIKATLYYGEGGTASTVVASSKSAAGITKVSNAQYTFRFDQTSTGISSHLTDAVKLVISATVKDGDANTGTINITTGSINPGTTDLTTEATFTLGRPSQTGFPESAMGITWSSNSSDGVTANFTVSGGVVVLQNVDQYNAITTQETLAYAFSQASPTTTFSSKSDASFAVKYLMVKDGATLRLVKMTGLNFAAGANKAYFTEKH